MKSSSFLMAFVGILVCAPVFAGERTFCSDDCSPDMMFVRFGDPANRVSEAELAVGEEFTITVTIDVVSDIQGFSLGVAHDPTKLQALEANITPNIKALNPFFDSASLAIGRGAEEVDPLETDLRFGFVAAAIFPILPAPGVTLEKEQNVPIASCRYRVIEELDTETPITLEFVNDLIPNPGAPPTNVNYTIGALSTPPASVVDGEVRGKGAGVCDDYGMYFGSDTSADGTLSVGDNGVFMRNAQGALGFSAGISVDGTTYTFKDDVLGNANDTIQLLITDNNGDEHTPSTNSATGPELTDGTAISSVSRGGAVAGFNPGDFFGVDLSPSVGGSGLTIGYVSDVGGSGNVIPATGGGDPCPVNEVLVITIVGEGVAGPCPLWGYAFGDDPRVADFQAAGNFPITMRNESDALGFSMGVQTNSAGGNTTYTFVDDVLGNTNTTIQNIIPDNQGREQAAAAGNTATGADQEIKSVTEGSAIADFNGGFLAVDLNPSVGGNGFTVGYVADTSGTGDVIPGTGVADCPTNEILIVGFEDVGPVEAPFNRGDVTGDGRLNVTDGAIAAQQIFFNGRLGSFDCDEMLDADNNDALDTTDVVMILQWVFLNGADLAAPFMACDNDPGDQLGCIQSNCQ